MRLLSLLLKILHYPCRTFRNFKKIFFRCLVKPVSPKGNQLWIFIGRTDAEAEASILWPPDVKSWLVGKDPDAGKDWGQEEKRMTEDEVVGWRHWFNGHGFEQTLGDDEGQGSLACCSPWGHKELDMIEQLNNERTMRLTTSGLICSLLDLHCLTQDLSLGFSDSTRGPRAQGVRLSSCSQACN